MQQLTIFDVMYQFDENLANWKDVLGQFEKCIVLAYIPEDALSPLEQGYSGPGNQEKERRHKLWGDYTTAIWHHISFVDDAWEKACRKLQEYRDTNKPCPMEIHRSNHFMRMNDFKPDHVIEYL